MLRLAIRAKRAAPLSALTALLHSHHKPISNPLPSSSTVRSYGTNAPDSHPVALQIINYALHHARSQKSGESYAQALLVLEQGLSNFRGVDDSSEDAVGMVLLAMSTMLSERGEFSDAMEKLQEVLDLPRSSLSVRVASLEGLIGLNLVKGQDVTSSILADKSLQLLRNRPSVGDNVFELLQLRSKAIKGLVDLVQGNLKSADSCFGACEYNDSLPDKGCSGNVALSHGEFLHSTGNFSLAKDFYQKALQVPASEASALAAANMVPEEVSLGAMCALGQLATHSGNFQDAEETLTKALTKAEEHFGSNHPKVGLILTCIAIMFGHKGKLEHSSSLVIQEGLYRRALDLLKAPSLETEVVDTQVDWRDVVALARELLCVQQNRKGEGERMSKWAETMWGNRRLSLAEALEISEPSKVAVIDSRISRVM
ncbi:tetratricopeptide repeat (TPR)-like superfamily protein isoform X2 [Tasmannia lanceolata]|uniref:tetratricopeptide repeat (TPR)-like superfamily protein isoform X2 n=1 Tax=Tasmannia lanceolata TaxID=3420 RepID=UPI0040629807